MTLAARPHPNPPIDPPPPPVHRFTVALVALAVAAAVLVGSLASAEPSQAQGGPVPDQPTGLSAEASHDRVGLTWDDPGDGSITHYEVLRRDRGVHDVGEFVTVEADTGSAAAGYSDHSAQPQKRYVYRVVAVNAHGASKWSSFARADTPAAPPQPDPAPDPAPAPAPAPGPDPDPAPAPEPDPDPAVCAATGPCTILDQSDGVAHVETLELTGVTHESVTLEWAAPAGAAPLGYVIVRTDGGAAPSLSSVIVANTESQNTSHTDSGLEPDTLYEYRVLALRHTGVSAYKDAASASATTEPAPAPAPEPEPEPAPAPAPAPVVAAWFGPPPLAPSGLAAVLVTDGAVPPTVLGVQLGWDAPAEDAGSVTGYEIRRGPVGDEHTVVLVGDTATGDTAYFDSTATDQSYYFYEVVALRGTVRSESPETVYVSLPTVTTPAPPEAASASALVTCGATDNAEVTGLRLEHRLRHDRALNGGKPIVEVRLVLTDVDGADTWNLDNNLRFVRIGISWDSNYWASVYPVMWRLVWPDDIGDWQHMRQVFYGDDVELFAYAVREHDSAIVPDNSNTKDLNKCFTANRSDTIGDPQPPQGTSAAKYNDDTDIYFAGPTVTVDISDWFTDPNGLPMSYYVCDRCDFYNLAEVHGSESLWYLNPKGNPLATSWISGTTLHIRATNNLQMFGSQTDNRWMTDYDNIYNEGRGFITVAAINSAGGTGALDMCFRLRYDAAQANRPTVGWPLHFNSEAFDRPITLPCATNRPQKVGEWIARSAG